MVLFFNEHHNENNSTNISTTTQKTSDTEYNPIIAVSQIEAIKKSKSSPNIEIANKQQISLEDIEVLNELGRGSYGRVCLGQWNGAAVALKFCKEKGGLDKFWKEVKLMTYTISQ
jgi:hypothetical protein